MLRGMMKLQRKMQTVSYGKDPLYLEGEERAMFIKDMSLALMDEIHEALAEVGWKPWATSRHVNDEAFKGELIDAWHFLMNLFLVAGMDSEEIESRYLQKRAKNIQRQADGYDGVEGKCPRCHRALDDVAVRCTKEKCFVQSELF